MRCVASLEPIPIWHLGQYAIMRIRISDAVPIPRYITGLLRPEPQCWGGYLDGARGAVEATAQTVHFDRFDQMPPPT